MRAKHEVDGSEYAQRRPEKIESQWLPHVQHHEWNEDRERDDFLQDLQLKTAEVDVTPAIRRHRQAVLDQGDAPGDQDRLPQWPRVAVLEMPVPGECHEYVRTDQQQSGCHEAAAFVTSTVMCERHSKDSRRAR